MFTESPRFWESISQGAVGGPGFKSTVVTLDSGSEQVFSAWQYPLHEYDVAFGVKHQSDLDVVRQLFWVKRAQAGGFRYKDWADYTIDFTRGVLLPTGIAGQYQIAKTYSFGTETAYRLILKPNADSSPYTGLGQQIKRNGVLDANYTIDNTTGLVQYATGHYPATGDVLAVATCFDVPVRFNVDKMMASLDDFDVTSWGQITLLEQRVPA